MSSSASSSASDFSLASTIKLNNGIVMPRIHLGVYLTHGRETSNAVTYALNAGYKAIDSAQWYANEKEVGNSINKFIKESGGKVKREDVWFTTKLKNNTSYDDTRRKIRRSIKESGMGYLDLFLIHSPYGGRQTRLDCWRAIEDAIDEGEVRAGGVSNYGVKHVSAVQVIAL
jgi:diketogulonate reductase-like aldo/keto reductase